jgi:RNase adaptor protein for sRNA GlmZ degradation
VSGRKPVLNPFYKEHLRPLTGRSPIIRDYIFADEEARWRRQNIDRDLVVLLQSTCSERRRRIPERVSAGHELYEPEPDDLYVIVTLCTGGKHRSQAFAVYITEKAMALAQQHGIELDVNVVFRDEGKE